MKNGKGKKQDIVIPRFSLKKDFGCFFENDYWLLLLLIVIECSNDGKKHISFDSLFKGQYWDDRIAEGFDGIHDYESIEDYIFENIFCTICSDLKIATIMSLGIDGRQFCNFNEIVINFAMQNGSKVINPLYHDELFYADILDVYCSLKRIVEQERGAKLDAINEPVFLGLKNSNDYRVFFDRFLDLAVLLPEIIIIKVKWKNDRVVKIDESLLRLIKDYTCGDEFNTQIDKFHDHICDLKIVNNIAKISLDSLLNRDFSIVKILKYLELNDIAEIEA